MTTDPSQTTGVAHSFTKQLLLRELHINYVSSLFILQSLMRAQTVMIEFYMSVTSSLHPVLPHSNFQILSMSNTIFFYNSQGGFENMNNTSFIIPQKTTTTTPTTKIELNFLL